MNKARPNLHYRRVEKGETSSTNSEQAAKEVGEVSLRVDTIASNHLHNDIINASDNEDVDEELIMEDSRGNKIANTEGQALLKIRSPVVDAPVVTVAVTTIVNANVAVGSKAKDASKDFENIRDSTSAGGVNADAVSVSKFKNSSSSPDSFYASQSLDTETMHRVYNPRWKVTNDSILKDPYVCQDLTDRLAPIVFFTKLRAMDYDQLYYEFNIGAARQKRMHLKSLLSLKESEAAEAISLRSQLSVVEAADAAKSTELRVLKEKNFACEGERNVLSERVATLESVTTSKEDELASLSSQVAKLTADLSGF
ncbi:hypothetical protein Tco_0989794 [Tanacetum coccineum]|uniref:Uncharacterized protein n=1 Tax=Tanacetum coccineum TaxID=301880 RepID=A0ABQ5EUX1_9ASTR